MNTESVKKDFSVFRDYDAVVVGAGFYGAMVALHLARKKGFKRIVILEREDGIMTRASLVNQARVHNGYHYPRSFTTAVRSRASYEKFKADWQDCLSSDALSYYAIAKDRSKIAPSQFESFAKAAGAPLENVTEEMSHHFDMRRIERIYRVDEVVFDATKLAARVLAEVADAGIEVILNAEVSAFDYRDRRVTVRYSDLVQENNSALLNAKFVFNCSYSGITSIKYGDGHLPVGNFKYELAEMGLFRLPVSLSKFAITVMDGPFFSTLPWPSRGGLHSLSHVRITPIVSWQSNQIQSMRALDKIIAEAPIRSEAMLRDATRYVPDMGQAQYVESIHEIKTILAKNEVNDGRPIFFEKSKDLSGLYTVLGGKIDNIYDVLSRLDEEDLRLD